MDLSLPLALLNLVTFNLPLAPTANEMENRYEADVRLRRDLFKNYDGSMPAIGGPVRVIPIMIVDHIRAVDEYQGSLTVSTTFTFTWMDPRLAWNKTDYSGVRSITGTKTFFQQYDLWTPSLHLADLPGSTKQADLFMNHDVDMYIDSSGTVRATIKVLVTTPCYFAFGQYPNDYQNCSFTLMSPYYADELQFADWGGIEFAHFFFMTKRITDVQDFNLISVDSRGYYMYLGLRIVDDLAKYKPSYCRGYFRFNMTLKRMNKTVFAQISVPTMVVCILVGLSGILPNKYGLAALVFSVGFQILNAISIAEVLPDDYNGMPVVGVLVMFIMFETGALIVWRVFSMHVRASKKYNLSEEEMFNSQTTRMLEIVMITDRVLMIVLVLQCFGNLIIVWRN